MRSSRQAESSVVSGDSRGAASAAPRTTPLTIVSAAVAGENLESIAAATAAELGRPVAIALAGVGQTVLWPESERAPGILADLIAYAAAVIRGEVCPKPDAVADSVAIQIGHEIVGIVASLGPQAAGAEDRPWLEAAAAAAAVSSLIRETKDSDLDAARRALLQTLALAPPQDARAMVGEALRLGCDLAAGAAAICARWTAEKPGELPSNSSVLLAEVSTGRVLGLVPVSLSGNGHELERLCSELEGRGMDVATSMPRRDPAALHDSIREAEVMLSLSTEPDTLLSNQEETYRLLIGVLLRDPAELQALRSSTISALEHYDAEHDTDLLATLQAFLAHHGSTTETAEAMQLHRHTVGYRLTRVQEVSGLSPYESDGRERLSLGIKAHRILKADTQRARGLGRGPDR
jgi:PucR C-terminal helix-turn-helix domain